MLSKHRARLLPDATDVTRLRENDEKPHPSSSPMHARSARTLENIILKNQSCRVQVARESAPGTRRRAAIADSSERFIRAVVCTN